MVVKNFNQHSGKPAFYYSRNPLVQHSFQIFQLQETSDTYAPVGEYTLLDLEENPDLTEKRVMNIVAILNDRDRTIDLSALTDTRMLFTVMPLKPQDTQRRIIFRTFNGQGISKQNAILVLDKDLIGDVGGFIGRVGDSMNCYKEPQEDTMQPGTGTNTRPPPDTVKF